MDRGFSRKEHRIPNHLGVDEKAFAKGHKYETLVYENDRGTVEYVGDYRSQQSLEEYYRRFIYCEKENVESVTMDIWDPYIAATKAQIPDAEEKIVFDRFHIMKILNEAVNKVRKEKRTKNFRNRKMTC